MLNPDYIRIYLTPQRIADVLDRVRRSELNDLCWTLKYHFISREETRTNQELLAARDTESIVGAGLDTATARLVTTVEPYEPELSIWQPYLKGNYWVHVPNRRLVRNPNSSRANSSAPTWLDADSPTKSTQYCDRLNEILREFVAFSHEKQQYL